MKTVRDIADEILAREGGYVDDPDDPGGATNHGVTIGTLRRLGVDVDGDGDVDKADVRALTRERARDILIEHYFRRPRIDELPQSLQATVFDMHVNAGSNAIRILQRLVGDLGEPVAVDGVLGSRTIAAARRAAARAPAHIADAYRIARRNYYYGLGDKRPALRKFARRRDGGKGGWIRRSEDFIHPKFHLSATEHLERTAGWA